jgi:hypothetical protein
MSANSEKFLLNSVEKQKIDQLLHNAVKTNVPSGSEKVEKRFATTKELSPQAEHSPRAT